MISKLFSPTLRISIGLVGLTISLILSAYVLDLIPDERKIEVNARGKIAEALAIQLSSSVTRNEIESMQQTVSQVVERNTAMLSVALRHESGKLLVVAGDHQRHWIEPPNNRSTPTHVQVLLGNIDKNWGKIEIVFAPLQSGEYIGGFSKNFLLFICLMAVLCFCGFFFLLRRTLRELDPGNVIPERVHSAFNTLAEGVLILDENGNILLANNAFGAATDKNPKSLFGSNIEDLKWQTWGEQSQDKELPWQVATRDQENVTGVKIGYHSTSGKFKNFVVNVTCIRNEKNVTSGVIVTFDDVTVLEQKNDDLILAIKKLQKSEDEINHKNHKLQYLADHDALTGCLNRRAFFKEFATSLEQSDKNGHNFACLMVDLDHFKKINDNFGHVVGDNVIAGMADILKKCCRDEDLVGRYGGEEFCIALVGRTIDECQWLADQIREQAISHSKKWLNSTQTVTASIGIATLPPQSCSVMEIVNRADQALYQAKETGRNKVVIWDQNSNDRKPHSNPQLVATTAQASEIVDRDIDKMNNDAGSLSPVNPQSMDEPLTKLPSRYIFTDRVNQSIGRAVRDKKKVAVIQISLASFDRFAAAFGDVACNNLINAVSERFTGALRHSDTISLFDGANTIPILSRISDDKFLIELSNLDDRNSITWIVKRLFDSLSSPFHIEGEKYYATGNIGVSVYPGDGDDAETLIQHASAAQQHARELTGTNNCTYFSQSMNRNSRQQLKLEAGIRHAFKNGEFTLLFQPITNANSGSLNAIETLLRCTNPKYSGVPISTIITIAEQCGLIVDIGEWVIQTAIRQANKWARAVSPMPIVSINLSAVQLSNRPAMERIMQMILEMDLPPKKLQFEITETAILKDVETTGHVLTRLQQLGVMIALDDFGTGQSSLGYLRRFRPDVLKIDRCFISEINSSHADETLVSAIIAMSQRMGIKVVAEGVETIDQMQKLREMGCDEIQGYYIAKPMPGDAIIKWMQSRDPVNVIPGEDNNRPFSQVA